MGFISRVRERVQNSRVYQWFNKPSRERPYYSPPARNPPPYRPTYDRPIDWPWNNRPGYYPPPTYHPPTTPTVSPPKTGAAAVPVVGWVFIGIGGLLALSLLALYCSFHWASSERQRRRQKKAWRQERREEQVGIRAMLAGDAREGRGAEQWGSWAGRLGKNGEREDIEMVPIVTIPLDEVEVRAPPPAYTP